jgi:hypothetical protein
MAPAAGVVGRSFGRSVCPRGVAVGAPGHQPTGQPTHAQTLQNKWFLASVTD